MDTDKGEQLYFVVETKGSVYAGDLRHRVGAKIACGRKHFEAIGEIHEVLAKYVVARMWEDIPVRR